MDLSSKNAFAGLLVWLACPPILLASSAPRISLERGFAPVVQSCLPAVVRVSATKVVKAPDDGIEGALSGSPSGRGAGAEGSREESLGSGIIISADGYIVTNEHVIEGAAYAHVRLGDRRELK